tara:strand:+ start:25502 stop:26140 length:639 start_codon:yes stop_codon:yes gene_type:complete
MVRGLIVLLTISVLFSVVFIGKKLYEGESLSDLFQESASYAKEKTKNTSNIKIETSIKSKENIKKESEIIFDEYIAKISKNYKGDKFYQYFKIDDRKSKYKIGNQTKCYELKDIGEESFNEILNYIDTKNVVLNFSSFANVDSEKNIDLTKELSNLCSNKENKGVVVYEAVLFEYFKGITIIDKFYVNKGYIEAKKAGLFRHEYFPNIIESK